MTDSPPRHDPGKSKGAVIPVLVALGSNLGDSVANIRAAGEFLRQRSAGEFRASSVWKSEPVDCPPGSPDFFNAAVRFRPLSQETPESLLNALLEWERESGRERGSIRNAPRALDLDLIAFGEEVRNTPELHLPHPRAHLRRFVLEPLVELEPDLRLPGWTRTAREYLAAVSASERVVRVGPLMP